MHWFVLLFALLATVPTHLTFKDGSRTQVVFKATGQDVIKTDGTGGLPPLTRP